RRDGRDQQERVHRGGGVDLPGEAAQLHRRPEGRLRQLPAAPGRPAARGAADLLVPAAHPLRGLGDDADLPRPLRPAELPGLQPAQRDEAGQLAPGLPDLRPVHLLVRHGGRGVRQPRAAGTVRVPHPVDLLDADDDAAQARLLAAAELRPRPMTTRGNRRARGQAAAMMALTMMLIALMVCITLGVGMKVKEKMETQTLADASAYSGAVLTARTFNSIAIVNRVEIADMVSVVASQSLVAYGGYYRSMLWSAREQLQVMHDAGGVCPDDGVCNWCTRYTTMMGAVDGEINRINSDWYAHDALISVPVVEGRGAAGNAYDSAKKLYEDLRDNRINSPGGTFSYIVQRTAQGSDWPAELTAPATANAVNSRELGTAANCDPTSEQLICEGDAPKEVPVQ